MYALSFKICFSLFYNIYTGSAFIFVSFLSEMCDKFAKMILYYTCSNFKLLSSGLQNMNLAYNVYVCKVNRLFTDTDAFSE